ncbi:MAG: FliM/FliN family flagellar motor switch protein [Bdellovibrionales bacterium]|nr:FliM/FliN family flagellar motor switch protein [Bdellovibrionales bacterium]
MQGEGRIADHDTAEMIPWDARVALEHVSPEEARFSRGFLRASPGAWCAGLAEHWLPLFYTLGSDLTLRSVQRQFELPDQVFRCTAVEFDGEPGCIGFDARTCRRLAEEIVPGIEGVAADMLLEYLERRLLASLALAWCGSEPLSCSYLGARETSEVVCSGWIGLELELSGIPVSVWFGCGPRALDVLDAQWRARLLESDRERGGNPLGDQIHSVSVELAQLAVPPAMLIDYMRPGTLIDLEVPVSTEVQIKIDGALWAAGTLCQFDGAVAVRIHDTTPEERPHPEATTLVRVQVARTELDEAGIVEHAQVGAILLCDSHVSNRAAVIISGENVASAAVVELDGRFALQILSQ